MSVYHFLFFTDWCKEADVKRTIGGFYMWLIFIVIAFNLSLILRNIVYLILRKFGIKIKTPKFL